MIARLCRGPRSERLAPVRLSIQYGPLESGPRSLRTTGKVHRPSPAIRPVDRFRPQERRYLFGGSNGVGSEARLGKLFLGNGTVPRPGGVSDRAQVYLPRCVRPAGNGRNSRIFCSRSVVDPEGPICSRMFRLSRGDSVETLERDSTRNPGKMT